MTEAWANGHVIESLPAQRELDMAEGILMGLRRCGPAAAYREPSGAAKRHRLGVNDIAALMRNYTQTALKRNQGNGNDLVAALYHLDNALKALQRS